MRKYLFTIFGITVALTFAVNCNKKSDEAFVAELGKTLCYKVADCAAESLKQIPEAQQQQMKGLLPSRESCDAKGVEKNEKVHEAIVLSREEKEMGQKCMEELKKAPCSSMGDEAASCKEFTSLMESKKKS